MDEYWLRLIDGLVEEYDLLGELFVKRVMELGVVGDEVTGKLQSLLDSPEPWSASRPAQQPGATAPADGGERIRS